MVPGLITGLHHRLGFRAPSGSKFQLREERACAAFLAWDFVMLAEGRVNHFEGNETFPHPRAWWHNAVEMGRQGVRRVRRRAAEALPHAPMRDTRYRMSLIHADCLKMD